MFVDSDDWIDVDTCETAMSTILKYNVDVVLWSYIREFPNNPKPKAIFDEVLLFFHIQK